MTLNFNIGVQALGSPGTKKILVAYFSHSGNTKAVAERIGHETGAGMFRIEPVTPYPQGYNILVDRAKKEMENNYQPPIKDKVSNIDSYNIIFVGSPNWWGTIALPVATFLAEYDLSGKTIIPFIRHEGSRMGRSVDDIKKLCPRSAVLKGLPVLGSHATRALDEIPRWLQSLNIIE